VTTDAPGAVERVLVIGGPGAGKSTLAARLGAALGLPVVHLDAHFWRPGWQESPRPEWAARVAELAAAERWVMDGHYAGTLAVRARAADVVVALAPPRLTCVARLVRRGLRDRGRRRADLAPGCPEQLPPWSFLREAWAFGERELPAALAVLASPAAARADGTRARLVVLRSAGDAERFVADAPREAARRAPHHV
jgi:adenylate kinase family enzyme